MDDHLRTLADRVEIEALRGEFTDAAMMRDWDRLASLFALDGVWRIPGADIEFAGREAIRAGIERMRDHWEYLVQNTHPGTIQLDGDGDGDGGSDTATGRAYITELGRFRDGSSHQNCAVYHDGYRRTPDGWKFTLRSYEIFYYDTAPLTGSPPETDQ